MLEQLKMNNRFEFPVARWKQALEGKMCKMVSFTDYVWTYTPVEYNPGIADSYGRGLLKNGDYVYVMKVFAGKREHRGASEPVMVTAIIFSGRMYAFEFRQTELFGVIVPLKSAAPPPR